MNILLLGLGGNVTQGILKALRLIQQPEIRIVGACVSATSAGLYMCDSPYISPYANSDEFLPWLAQTCDKEGIDAVMSGVEEVLEVLALHKESLEKKIEAKLLVCNYDTLLLGRDKLTSSRWLQDNNIPYPDFAACDDADNMDRLLAKRVPLIAKPRFGKGSQGIFRIRNARDLSKLTGYDNYILQEEIGTPDREYTVGCYCDKTGNLVACITMQRELSSGATSTAKIVQNEIIEQYARTICDTMQCQGPLNIQLRLDDNGNPRCFEMNIRFSGTTPIRAHFGFRDVEAYIHEKMFGCTDLRPFFAVRPGMAVRFWEEIYVEMSDFCRLNAQMEQ